MLSFDMESSVEMGGAREKAWERVGCGAWWMKEGIAGEFRFVAREQGALHELRRVAIVV